MRDFLMKNEGEVLKVRCFINRYGRNSCSYLLTDLIDVATDATVADHIWIDIGSWATGFRPGDTIEIEAKVIRYLKGHLGINPPVYAPSPEIDWTLDQPIHAEIISFGPTRRLMPDGKIYPLSE